ncbi:hypothetical protein D9M72_369950 [compost metagenome]
MAWMVYASDTHQLKRIVTTDPGDTAAFGCLKMPLYAAPLASAGDARRALGGYQTDSFRVLKTHPAPAAAKDGQQRAGDVAPLLARALDEWHEDDGPVMWWAWCGHEWAGEAPWCGTPHYQDWPGYHTHWTPIAGFPATPSPQSAAIRNPLIAEPSEDGSANG